MSQSNALFKYLTVIKQYFNQELGNHAFSQDTFQSKLLNIANLRNQLRYDYN